MLSKSEHTGTPRMGMRAMDAARAVVKNSIRADLGLTMLLIRDADASRCPEAHMARNSLHPFDPYG